MLATLRRHVLFARKALLRDAEADGAVKALYRTSLERVLKDHHALLDALVARDPARAEVTMRKHLECTATDMAAAIRASSGRREDR